MSPAQLTDLAALLAWVDSQPRPPMIAALSMRLRETVLENAKITQPEPEGWMFSLVEVK